MDAQDETPEAIDAPKRGPGRPKAEPKPEVQKDYVTIIGLKRFHISSTDIKGGTDEAMSLKVQPDQTVMNVKAAVANGLAKAGLLRIV